MTEEKKESRFPMTFEKCPYCGVTETVTQVAWAEEAEKGRVNKDTPVAAQHLQVPMIDPKKSALLIGGISGILILRIDYCAGCGAGYCTGVTVADGKVSQAPPPGQAPPDPLVPKGYG